MSFEPFRFVHAGDFHLERPLHGLAELPEHLRELFLEAPYLAAEQVFETVLSEGADFLVLSGDLLQPRDTGPRGPLFLVEQFERLAQRGIGVYWAGGRTDSPEAWPAAASLPGNVRVFPRGRLDEWLHERDGTPVARVLGMSCDRQHPFRPADFRPDPSGLFSLGVVFGNADAAALARQGLQYWALGGKHDRSTPSAAPRMAHYPGSPQGRQPRESGPHGCTVVDVDGNGRARLRFAPTDAARWHNERVVIEDNAGRDGLDRLLRERMQTFIEGAAGVDLVISWTVAGSGALVRELRRGKLGAELLAGLQADFGHGPPAAWSASLEVEPAAVLPPEWYDQETILGEFLRSVRHYQTDESEAIDLEHYLAERHIAGTIGAAVQMTDKAARQRLLRQVAMLGVDLLSGEELRP
ncbi:MAG: metallophosphoesterase family protein [Pirellulales bacterium]